MYYQLISLITFLKNFGDHVTPGSNSLS